MSTIQHYPNPYLITTTSLAGGGIGKSVIRVTRAGGGTVDPIDPSIRVPPLITGAKYVNFPIRRANIVYLSGVPFKQSNGVNIVLADGVAVTRPGSTPANINLTTGLGIIDWYGTRANRLPYYNPCLQGYMIASASSLIPNGCMAESDAFNKLITSSRQVYTQDIASSWFAWEFPLHTINVTAYAMQTNNTGTLPGNMLPRSWNFQGWNGSTWETIDSRSSVSYTAGTVLYYTLSVATNYSKYRIIQTGTNSGGSNNLVMCNLEMWGTIYPI
jgi:hypothetical protein